MITLDSLIERAKLAGGSDSISYLPVNNFLKEDDYKPAIDFIASRNQATATKTEVDDPDDLVPTKTKLKSYRRKILSFISIFEHLRRPFKPLVRSLLVMDSLIPLISTTC